MCGSRPGQAGGVCIVRSVAWRAGWPMQHPSMHVVAPGWPPIATGGMGITLSSRNFTLLG